MCEVCTNNKEVLVTLQQYDPSQTLTLRNTFARQLRVKFSELERVIQESIVDRDCFGLQNGTTRTTVVGLSSYQMNPTPAHAFQFVSNPQKVQGFVDWLNEQVDNGILQIQSTRVPGRTSINEAWTDIYIRDSYKRGVIRARYSLHKQDSSIPPLSETGGITASMSTPFHADRLGLLYTRAFQDLKGITAAMDTQISRVLAQGIADGDNPVLLARKLRSTISGKGMGELGLTDTLGRFVPAKRRAEMLARTEIIRAHAEAQLQEYSNWGTKEVNLQVEWMTGGNPCPECQAKAGTRYNIDEARGMLPLHPNCVCAWAPYNPAWDRLRMANGRYNDLK